MSRSPGKPRPAITWQRRLGCLLSGALLVAINLWAIKHGKLGSIHSTYRQPVFVSAVGAVGIVLIAAGAAPVWLVTKMAAIKKYRPYTPGRHGSPAERDETATKRLG